MHPVWGRSLLPATYLTCGLNIHFSEADVTVKFDSLMLVLSSSGDFVGDTTLQQRYFIHLLTEKIILNDNGYLYNNCSHLLMNPNRWPVILLYLGLMLVKKLEIRLPDELGQDC